MSLQFANNYYWLINVHLHLFCHCSCLFSLFLCCCSCLNVYNNIAETAFLAFSASDAAVSAVSVISVYFILMFFTLSSVWSESDLMILYSLTVISAACALFSIRLCSDKKIEHSYASQRFSFRLDSLFFQHQF